MEGQLVRSYGLLNRQAQRVLQAAGLKEKAARGQRWGQGWTLTLPNALSASRPALMLLFWYSMAAAYPRWVCLLCFALAELTDLFDGASARLLGTTPFGIVLDPLCDRLAGVIALLACRPLLPGWLWWPYFVAEAAMLLAMIGGIVLLRAGKMREEDFLPSIYGRSKCFLLGAGLVLALLQQTALAALSILAALYCLARSVPIKRNQLQRSLSCSAPS